MTLEELKTRHHTQPWQEAVVLFDRLSMEWVVDFRSPDDVLHPLTDAKGCRVSFADEQVAEAAIASFLTPDAAQQQEAALGRRLDRLNRHADRLERDLEIAVEMLALFVRTWMAATPSLPDAAQAAARARGRDRYERFVENLGRRLASGRSFTRELAFELEEIGRAHV